MRTSFFSFPLLALLGVTSSASDGSSSPKEMKVSVVAILASDTNEQIDPRLESIAKEIQKIHPTMKGFRLAKMTCKSVFTGKGAETFELVADQTASITVQKTFDKDNRVQLKVTPPTLGEITYTTTCGKFFPIVTQHQTKMNEWLIIAVRVQPCNEKK